MKRRIQGDTEEYTSRRWVLAATLPVGGRGLVVCDPFYWKPRVEILGLDLRAPEGPAQVWLEEWKGEGRTTRFAAVRVVFGAGIKKGAKVRTRRLADTVAIDQGRL